MNSLVGDIAALVSAVASSIAAASVLVVWRQLRADHERSRRKLASDLVRFWASDMSQRSSITRKLVETLSFGDCKKLWDEEPFEVKREHAKLLAGCLPDGYPFAIPDDDKPILVSQEASVLIRWEMVSFLNKLESVLSPWRHNIADREIIKEEFRYLMSPEQDHFILENFRRAGRGGINFPAITDFAKELGEETGNSAGKPPAA